MHIECLLVHAYKMNMVEFQTVFFFHMNNMISLSPRLLIHILSYPRVEQVQEKKVKKIADMNVDPSKTMGNGSIASSSNSSSSGPRLANGGYPDGSYNYLSNDFSFPPGGIPSLRLPVVVVSSPSTCNSFSDFCSSGINFLWYEITKKLLDKNASVRVLQCLLFLL